MYILLPINKYAPINFLKNANLSLTKHIRILLCFLEYDTYKMDIIKYNLLPKFSLNLYVRYFGLIDVKVHTNIP